MTPGELERIRADLLSPPGPWPREQQMHLDCWHLLAEVTRLAEALHLTEVQLRQARADLLASEEDDD